MKLLVGLVILRLAGTARADDEWAILGQGLGCWSLETIRTQLAEKNPKLRGLKPFSGPDDFVRQLETLGVSATRKTVEAPHTPWRSLVIVELDDASRPDEDGNTPRRRALRFVERRHCTEHDD